jgi:hypothetical protein
MLVGGAIYDPAFLSGLLGAVGVHVHLDQATTLRFPIYLNLVTALLALWTVLGLREPSVRVQHVAPEMGDRSNAEAAAWHIAARAGRWIIGTPVALFVIVAGVMLDSVVRLFLTFSSSYFRLIHIPDAAFGLLGASLGGLGLLVAPLARRMVASGSVGRNYLLVALVVAAGLIGVACRWSVWGFVFMFPLGAAIMALGYMVSYYLNALADSSHRATVLSFKGVAFNLGYGFISLVFAAVLRALRDGGDAQEAVGRALAFLPAWVAFGAGLCALLFWKHRRALRQRV